MIQFLRSQVVVTLQITAAYSIQTITQIWLLKLLLSAALLKSPEVSTFLSPLEAARVSSSKAHFGHLCFKNLATENEFTAR